ncbi:MAG: hypothetical protein D6718_10540 [Acidobacteria bacterium]|nr:MAG: hypothetical protein D6718_10540 [Acidobacteriota bacterium]
MKRSRWTLPLLALAALSVPAVAQEGRWAVSAGLQAGGDPGGALSANAAAELAGWFVLNEHVDVGARVSALDFDADAVEAGGTTLPGGSVSVVPFEAAFRYYPLGSDRAWYPFVGASVATAASADYDGDMAGIPPELGLRFATDASGDSVGFGAEAGIRWDLSDRWFLEGGVRYLSLGIDRSGRFELVPGQFSPEVAVSEDLDAARVAIHVGVYF